MKMKIKIEKILYGTNIDQEEDEKNNNVDMKIRNKNRENIIWY